MYVQCAIALVLIHQADELAALAGRALAEAGGSNTLHETRLVALRTIERHAQEREATGETDRHTPAHATWV